MTQWFRGQLEGHYVGTGVGGPAVSQYGSADRYQLRIYRALIRNIEVLESKAGPPVDSESTSGSTGGEGETTLEADETPRDSDAPPASEPIPVELPDECFYQAKIEDTRLIGIRPRTCFEGTVYDVAVSQLQVTHSTKQGGKTYGRVVGEVYGRYLLPPEADPEAATEVAQELTAKRERHEPGSEEAISQLGAGEGEDEEDGLDALHPPTPPEEKDDGSPVQVPVPLLAVLVAVVLWLAAGIQPALVWLGLLIPVLIVRFILGGQFRVTTGQRIFGSLLILVQAFCVGVILLDWWMAGCLALNPYAVAGVGLTVIVAGVLPSAFPVLVTGAGMAGVLFLWTGDVASTCESLESKAKVEQAIEKPTVDSPGVPRTNDDGSWPRRGSRAPAAPPAP